VLKQAGEPGGACEEVVRRGTGALKEGALKHRVWKAATSKADPRQQQDWILKCLQGGRTHPLAAFWVATLYCSPPLLVSTLSELHTPTHTSMAAAARCVAPIRCVARATPSPSSPRRAYHHLQARTTMPLAAGRRSTATSVGLSLRRRSASSAR
jgi:hypothetical protein